MFFDFRENPYNLPSKLEGRRIRILDSTLREGEQCPGVSFTRSQSLQLAWMLDRFGVDQIEISPIVTREHEEVCQTLIRQGLRADIVAHLRALTQDIDVALKCDAKWIALYLSTSDLHLKHKLKISRGQVIERAVTVIDYAKSHGLRLRFTAEDASRTEPEFLVKFCRRISEAGADRIGITDTAGIMLPHGMYNLVKMVRDEVDTPLDVHCHNDLGFALANAMAGLYAGAEQIHTTVNGIGERAGIPSLAEVTMALVAQKAKLNVRVDMLTELSQFVSSYTRIPTPDSAPIVGRNAFRHKSGTHIAAILSNPMTYEPFPPEFVGNKRRVVFGEASGKHAAAFLLDSLGLKVTKEEAEKVAVRLKGLRRGDLFELEIE